MNSEEEGIDDFDYFQKENQIKKNQGNLVLLEKTINNKELERESKESEISSLVEKLAEARLESKEITKDINYLRTGMRNAMCEIDVIEKGRIINQQLKVMNIKAVSTELGLKRAKRDNNRTKRIRETMNYKK